MKNCIIALSLLVLMLTACKKSGTCPRISNKSSETETSQVTPATRYYLILNTGLKLEVSKNEYDAFAQGAVYYPLCPE